MMETQHQDIGARLQEAVVGAAMGGESGAALIEKQPARKGLGKGGTPPPGGRPKGVPNKVTRTIREAVEMASQPGACHPEGLAGWLIERARGGLGDRQIFAAMVNKAMPLQVQASVNGGVKLELSWLAARSIGTTTAQIAEQRSQVLDLQQESDGSYRIKDPTTHAGGGQGADGGNAPEAAGGGGGA